ncbi:MAG: glycogen/starch synthase, partial [Verrucomicrobiota bacterium]|nr:glycogen/starch synthase [Verrucomicrobiota bacterium]
AAALVPVLVREAGMPFRTVLTIHHLAEQGSFWGLDFGLTNLPERYFSLRGIEYCGRMNLLKGGVLYADRVTTVSERYRREILTPEGGCGLDPVLRQNAHKLSGILNGADYARWNPATDAFLPAVFDSTNLNGKGACRNQLLDELQLELPSARTIVFGMVARLVAEKGFGIVVPLLDRLLSDDVRLIILGEGDPAYETALAVAAKKYPGKFAYRQSYDERVAHLIEAGTDVTLVPSRIEPSGLSAMYSLKYGALPVACATGGIHEIIEDYDPVAHSGFGFLCYDSSTEAFWDSIKRAREIYRREPETWAALVQRAMSQNFAWETAAERYEAIYGDLVLRAAA